MSPSTAIYPNRVEDKTLVEKKLGLQEFGNKYTRFLDQHKNLIAIGYERIVYGDHGPYIELQLRNFQCKLLSKFSQLLPSILPDPEKADFYYFWIRTEYNLLPKIYWQVKNVLDLPNAPRRPDGKPSRFNRQEGYADYSRGFYYISPWEVIVE